MIKENKFYKKVANTERFYQVCEKISPPFSLQMLVEGNGDISIEELREAVKEVAKVNKGTIISLKRKGLNQYWFEASLLPSVKIADEKYFEQFDDNRVLLDNYNNPYFYNRLDVENGPACEIWLIKGKKTRILFRAHHSLMDARGLLFWSEEIFRYLKKEPLLGTNTTIRDIEYYKTFEQNSNVKKVPLGARSPSPLGKTIGKDLTPVWARKKLYGNYPTLVSQLIYLLTQESFKHSDRPATFMISADLRNKENNFQATTNLSSPMYLTIKKEHTWLDIYTEIITSFNENRDKQVDKSEAIVHFIPVNLLSNVLDKFLKSIYKKDSHLFSVAISNLGKIDPNSFSTDTFKCSNTIFLPVDIPGFSISLISVENPEYIELILSAPTFIANNGRLEKLMDSIELGLIELNKVSDSKSNVANEIEKKEIERFNNTETIYPKDKTVIDLFEEQVKLNPNNIAISMGETSITYSELDKKINSFSSYLTNIVGKASVVGLLAKHSIETLIAILGILKSGNAYLPIDPDHPTERIKFMLDDSNASCLFTNLDNVDFFEKEKIIFLNKELFSYENIDFENQRNELAYVMYTSGSTGKPKGVKVTNQNLINYILWVKKYGLLENERTIYPFYTSLSFDLTVTSIFLPLITGNQIEVYKNEDHKFAIKKIVDDKKANVIKLTPTHLKVLKEIDTKNCKIKKIITLGESLSTDLSLEIYNKFDKNVEIINQYGPTEATVGCMYHIFEPNKDKSLSVPVGIPGDNTYIYILNENNEEVSVGSMGEMYISGDCVAQGYLNREELNKERFIPDPFRKGKTMYKTGDLALRLQNFEIEYLGRIDEQVKLRGFRIELGEIESTLLEHPQIKESIVLLKENKDENLKYLIAYYISDSEIDSKDLKEFLSSKLPHYMIPFSYVSIKEIPLTVNGKINKKALLSIEENKSLLFSENENTVFKDDITKKVHIAISKVISQPEEKINENVSLFDLGIDSLSMTILFSKLTKELLPSQKEGYLIQNIDKILIDPTVKNLVDIIKKA